MGKEEVVHICNGTLLSHKKEWNLAICNDIGGNREYYAKWSKSKKDKLPYGFTHMWNLRNKTNKQREGKVREANQEIKSLL